MQTKQKAVHKQKNRDEFIRMMKECVADIEKSMEELQERLQIGHSSKA